MGQTTSSRKSSSPLDAAKELLVIGHECAKLGQFAQALDAYQKALDLTVKAEATLPQLTVTGSMGNVYLAMGLFGKALEKYEQCLALAIALGNVKTQATTVGNMGNVYLSTGQFQRALECFEQLRLTSVELRDIDGQGRALGSIGLVYDAQGRYIEALEMFNKHLQITIKTRNQSEEAKAYGNIGNTYSQMGRYPEALEMCEKQLQMATVECDIEALSRVRANLGRIYARQGQYKKALEMLNESLVAAIEMGDRHGEGIAYFNIGQVQQLQGNFIGALDMYTDYLKICIELNDQEGISSAYGAQGLVYADIGQPQKAVEMYESCLKIERQLNAQVSVAATLGNLGSCYYSMHRLEQASKCYKESYRIARDAGAQSEQATALQHLVHYHEHEGDFESALKVSEQILQYTIEAGAADRQASARNNMGTIYAHLGDLENARKMFSQALEIAMTTGNKREEAQALANLAKATALSGDLDQAVKDIMRSESILRTLRSQFKSFDEHNVSFNEGGGVHVNKLHQSILVQAARFHQALEVAEAGRSSAMRDMLESKCSLAVDGDMTVKGMLSLARKIGCSIIYYSVADSGISASTTPIEDDLLIYIWLLQPNGERVIFEQIASSSVISRGVHLLDFLNETLGMLSDTSNKSRHGFASEEDDHERNTSAEWATCRKRLEQLWRLLIAPIKKALPEEKGSPILIIPQGELFLVPFSALIDQDGSFFIEKYSIGLAPSLRIMEYCLLQEERTKRERDTLNPNDGAALVVGNPDDSLTAATSEAIDIANMLYVKPLLGSAATKGAVVARLASARWLHFATHGTLAATPGAHVLGTLKMAGGKNLEAFELQELSFPLAELAVLSACETARGRQVDFAQRRLGNLTRGDGVIGLVRALMCAGVPTVVGSLWRVEDASTRLLMVRFYENMISKGMNKAGALRGAMISLLKEERFSHPSLWAAFTVYGSSFTSYNEKRKSTR